MIFLVLTLVVLMAEPGESLFGGLKAMWKGGRSAYKGESQLNIRSVWT